MSNGKVAWPDFQTYMTDFKKKLMAEKNPCGEIVASKYAITSPAQPPEPVTNPLSAEYHVPESSQEELIDVTIIGGASTTLSVNTGYKPYYYNTGAMYASGGIVAGRSSLEEKKYRLATSYGYGKAVPTAPMPEPELERLIIGEKYMVDDTNVPFDEQAMRCVHEHHNIFTLRAIDVDKVSFDKSYRINILLRCDHCGLTISMSVRVFEQAVENRTIVFESIGGNIGIVINRGGSDRMSKGVDQLLCIMPINDYCEKEYSDPNKLFAMMEGCPDE